MAKQKKTEYEKKGYLKILDEDDANVTKLFWYIGDGWGSPQGIYANVSYDGVAHQIFVKHCSKSNIESRTNLDLNDIKIKRLTDVYNPTYEFEHMALHLSFDYKGQAVHSLLSQRPFHSLTKEYFEIELDLKDIKVEYYSTYRGIYLIVVCDGTPYTIRLKKHKLKGDNKDD